MKYDTISDAAHGWVGEFNAIPQAVIRKLMDANCNEVNEITPPGCGDQVYIYDGEYDGKYGYISQSCVDGDDDLYLVQIDGTDEEVVLEKSVFDVQYDDDLPMWGTMWIFGDICDNWWLEEHGGLQKMADCGFRVYEQEDFGYIFGIDGAGYSFYDAHWIPLYKARGLQWHREEEAA